MPSTFGCLHSCIDFDQTYLSTNCLVHTNEGASKIHQIAAKVHSTNMGDCTSDRKCLISDNWGSWFSWRLVGTIPEMSWSQKTSSLFFEGSSRKPNYAREPSLYKKVVCPKAMKVLGWKIVSLFWTTKWCGARCWGHSLVPNLLWCNNDM